MVQELRVDMRAEEARECCPVQATLKAWTLGALESLKGQMCNTT